MTLRTLIKLEQLQNPFVNTALVLVQPLHPQMIETDIDQSEDISVVNLLKYFLR